MLELSDKYRLLCLCGHAARARLIVWTFRLRTKKLLVHHSISKRFWRVEIGDLVGDERVHEILLLRKRTTALTRMTVLVDEATVATCTNRLERLVPHHGWRARNWSIKLFLIVESGGVVALPCYLRVEKMRASLLSVVDRSEVLIVL